MSLIIDINSVPWEILEQVKARLLKNRANRQKRQPERGRELRRVMRVDNGILAKQRWEEPSFIGAGSIHYSITICDEDDDTTQKINDDDWIAWSNKTVFTFANAIDKGKKENIILSSKTQKRFILIIPKNRFYDIQYYPTQWPRLAGDSNSDPVGLSFFVTRYDNSVDTSIEKPSDYFALIEKATGLPWAEVESVNIAVDNSGSMVRYNVAPDLNTFQTKLTELNIPFAEFITSEAWIREHL